MNNWMRVSFHKAQKHSIILNEGQSLIGLTVTGITARWRETDSPAMWPHHPDWSQPVTKGWNSSVKMVIPKGQNPQHQGYTVYCTLKQQKGYFDTVYSVLLDRNIHLSHQRLHIWHIKILYVSYCSFIFQCHCTTFKELYSIHAASVNTQAS